MMQLRWRNNDDLNKHEYAHHKSDFSPVVKRDDANPGQNGTIATIKVGAPSYKKVL